MFHKFSTPTKYILSFITFFVLIAILLFWVLPSMIQWHLSKDQVRKTISNTIGNNVKITGSTKVSLFPHVGITIHDVRVLSPMGSYNSNLAIIPTVHVGVSFSQILHGSIYSIENISLDHPKIYITNDTTKNKSSMSNLTETLFSISKLGFTHLNITDGTLVISNYIERSEYILNGINTDLALKKDSLTGELNLNWKGLDIALNGNMYREGPDHSIYTIVNFNLLDNALSGHIDSHISNTIFSNNNIKANIVVNSPDTLLTQLNLSSPPKDLDSPFSINLDLKEKSDQSWHSSKFILSGKSDITTGSIAYIPLKEQISNAQLNIKTQSKNLNMNALISYIKTIHPEENNPNLGKDVLNYRISAITPISSRSALVNNVKQERETPKPTYKISWVIPQNLDINLENKSDSIALLNATASNFVFNTKIKANEILIKEASASFPGDASFKLFGFIHSSKGQPMLDGTILFNSNNPTKTLKWLGIDNQSTNNNELNASFRTTVLVDNHKLQLKNLVFNMGRLNFKGALTKILENERNLNVAGSFSTLPFDDWVPYIIKTISSVDNNSLKGALSTIFDHESFNSPISVKLLSTDATLSGIALKDVNLDLSIDKGDLVINKFKAMPIGDGSIMVNGQINDLFTDPEFNNVIIKASLKDTANALDSNILPSNIPANATISIVGNVKNTNADINFTYSNMKGSIRTGGSWQTGVMYPLVVNLSNNNLTYFLDNLGYTDFNDTGTDNEFNLTAVIKKSATDNIYKLSELDATVGHGDVNGDASFDLTKDTPNLALHLNTEELSYNAFLNVLTQKSHSITNPKPVKNNEKSPLIKLVQNLNMDILLNVKKLLINKNYVSNVTVKANAINGIFTLDNTALEFENEDVIPPTAHVKFSWDTNPAIPTSNLSWTSKNVDIASILPNIGLQGKVTSQGNVKGYGYNMQQIFDDINGAGNISITNIQYSGQQNQTTLAPLGSIYDALTIINKKQIPYNLDSKFILNTGLLKFTNGKISNALSSGSIDGIINLEKKKIQASATVSTSTAQHWFTLSNTLSNPKKLIDNKK